MSKAKFRSRKIDFKRPLPVYRASELPDLDDASVLQRTSQLVETGVEKEEEEEHHLQAVISAAQAAASGTGNDKVAPLYIPTPDASRSVANYHEVYRKSFSRPTSYIRFSATVEDSMGCPYCMDEDDTAWLNQFNKSLKSSQKVPDDVFEATLWQFEQLTCDMVFQSVDDIPAFASLEQRAQEKGIAFHSQAKPLYDYWRTKKEEMELRPLMPTLKFEELGRTTDSDPYVCFRRREVKPLRKTRRTDAHSLEKLRKMHLELESARTLLEMVARREKMRKESLVLEQIIFKQKCTVLEQRRALNHPRDENDELFGSRRKSRKATGGEGGRHTITIPLRKIKDSADCAGSMSTAASSPATAGLLKVPFQVPPKLVPSLSERAVAEVARRRALNEGWLDTTANPYEPRVLPHSLSLFRPFPSSRPVDGHTTSTPRRAHPYRLSTGEPVSPSTTSMYCRPGRSAFRCRMGRGGRLFMDRRHIPVAPADPQLQRRILQRYDYDYDPYRYDDGGAADFDDLILMEPAHRDTIRIRAGLLSEADQRNLITQPAFIPFSANTSLAGGANSMVGPASQSSVLPATSGNTATPTSTTNPVSSISTKLPLNSSTVTSGSISGIPGSTQPKTNKIQLSSEAIRTMLGSGTMGASPIPSLVSPPTGLMANTPLSKLV